MTIDAAFKHYLLTVQTQNGIIEYAEAMAQVLAAAGRASRKATGDAADYAVRKWSDVIRDRALDILRAEQAALVAEKKAQLDKITAARKQLAAP
jgi:hypothetical protein